MSKEFYMGDGSQYSPDQEIKANSSTILTTESQTGKSTTKKISLFDPADQKVLEEARTTGRLFGGYFEERTDEEGNATFLIKERPDLTNGLVWSPKRQELSSSPNITTPSSEKIENQGGISGQRSGIGEKIDTLDPRIKQMITQAESNNQSGVIGVLNETGQGDLELIREINDRNESVFYARDPQTGLRVGIAPGADFKAEMVLRDPSEPPEGITYRSREGFPIDANIPENPIDKMEWVRTLLRDIELSEADIDADPAISYRVKEMHDIITHLMGKEYIDSKAAGDPNKTIGKELHDEFIDRIKFHKSFLAFTSTDKIEEVEGVIKQITGDQLNRLFRISEFVQALNLYEHHGEYFADMTGRLTGTHTLTIDQAHEEFRNWVETSLAGVGGLNPGNIKWARNLAERFWRMSGRRATQAQVNPNTKGEYVFEDSFSKGDDVYRKILKFREWAQSDKEKDNLRAYMALMNGVDLQERDYVKDFMESWDDIQKATGIDVRTAIVPKTGRFDFTDINWKVFDFNKAKGETPMGYWAFRRIKAPDEARNALIGKPDSLLRQPSTQALVALNEAFNYQKNEQYVIKGKLLVNLVNFFKSKEAKKMGYIKPDRAGIDSIIRFNAQNLGLKPEEANKLVKDKLGDSGLDKIALALSYYRGDQMLITFILEILKGILQQGVSLK